MKNKTPFSLCNRIKSVAFALTGIKTFFASEHNAWLQTVAAVTAIGLGCWFQITAQEWIAIIIAIALVFLSEILNTAIEQLTDMVSPQYNDKAKKVKDIAAGAVLVAAIAAAVIGIIVFSKYVLGILPN